METVKCVIWDLDDTLWRGTIAYSDDVAIESRTFDFLRRVELAGVVQSIASKNESDHALGLLSRLGVAELFVYPQISWGPKSEAVRHIIASIGVSADAVIFVDDSAFERSEVQTACPEVRCFTLKELMELDAELNLFQPASNSDASRRPASYRAEERRRASEHNFEGTPVEFLASLGMSLQIAPATLADVARASELTVRTNQLNTSGVTYSSDEIRALIESQDDIVLIARLQDRFGDYGRIGLAIIRRDSTSWTIELLLMSCRVMGRNVGNAFIGAIQSHAAAEGVRLRANYLKSSKNRQMLVTYKLLGFETISLDGPAQMLEYRGVASATTPSYISIHFAGRTESTNHP